MLRLAVELFISVSFAPFFHVRCASGGRRWTARRGRVLRSKHGSRQTKTNPVWHAPRRLSAPCHPSLCCVSPFVAVSVVLFPLRGPGEEQNANPADERKKNVNRQQQQQDQQHLGTHPRQCGWTGQGHRIRPQRRFFLLLANDGSLSQLQRPQCSFDCRATSECNPS